MQIMKDAGALANAITRMPYGICIVVGILVAIAAVWAWRASASWRFMKALIKEFDPLFWAHFAGNSEMMTRPMTAQDDSARWAFDKVWDRVCVTRKKAPLLRTEAFNRLWERSRRRVKKYQAKKSNRDRRRSDRTCPKGSPRS